MGKTLVYPTYSFFMNTTDKLTYDVIERDKSLVKTMNFVFFLGALVINTSVYTYSLITSEMMAKPNSFETLLWFTVSPFVLWVLTQTIRKNIILSSGKDILYSDTRSRVSSEVNITNTLTLGLLLSTFSAAGAILGILIINTIAFVMSHSNTLVTFILVSVSVVLPLITITGRVLNYINRKKLITKQTIEGP